MTSSVHDQAMALLDSAYLLEAEGKLEAAREQRERAAELETDAADATDETRPRTRGILRVGAVSLWMQAGRLAKAELLAHRYLAEPLAPGFARELHGLLNEMAGLRSSLHDVPQIPDADVPKALERLRRVEESLASGSVPLVGAAPRAA